MNGTLNSWKKGESSGTGFVIAADGYIATCAHVVAKAATLEVVLNGKTYNAKLVAQNTQKDLAIIKIDASGLPVCALADSDKIELAETVRAFGYPLSTVLGADLKVATGSVAGIVNQPRIGRRIQTDAPINPGNSGGPVVDTSGRVIGIASAKLSNRIASSVGLLVPVNDLKVLMSEASLSVADVAVANEVEGPAIAKGISPSMALIRLTGVDGPIFDMNVTVRNTSGNVIRLPTGFRSSSRPGEMKFSRFGEILESKGTVKQLPFGIGKVNEFCLVPLDYLGRTEWSAERQIMLQLALPEPMDPLTAMMRQRNLPSPFGARAPQATKSLPAEEIVKYTMTIQREVTVTNKSTGVPFGANPFGANPFGPQAGGSGQRVSIAELQSAMGDDAIPLLKQFCDVQLSSTERTQLYEAAEPLLSADGSDVRLAAVKTLKAQATPELSERLQKLTPSSKDGKAAVALVQESIEGDRETCIEIIELLERQASGKLTEADKSKLDAKQREEEADELIKSRSRRQFLEEAILENMDKFSTARSQKAGVSALMVCGSERCLPVLKELAKTIPEAGAVIFAIQIRLKTEK